jgi:hypothetical protein
MAQSCTLHCLRCSIELPEDGMGISLRLECRLASTINYPLPAAYGFPARRLPIFTASFRPDHVGIKMILESPARAGMSMVYSAEERHSMRRKVALEVITLGMDTRKVIGKFEENIKPGIARILSPALISRAQSVLDYCCD